MSRPKKISDFQKLRISICLSPETCADLLGVTVAAVTRWDNAPKAPAIAMRFLKLYDKKSCSGQGPGWESFKFSRGKLVSGKLSFTPRLLRMIPHYVDVYNRVEIAKIRLQDGYDSTKCLGIVFASEAFREIPLLTDQS